MKVLPNILAMRYWTKCLKAEVKGPHQTSLAGLMVRVAPAVLLQTHVALAVVLAAPVIVAEGAVGEVG